MFSREYLMESSKEARRLELKTDFASLEEQALWGGLKTGMSVLDVGTGSGITASYLYTLTGESGNITGIDSSLERIEYAADQYGRDGIRFIQKDVYGDLNDLGTFDFIWVRFFLEYHKSGSFDIVKKLKNLLNPGGILCLVDLDHNALNHYELPDSLQSALAGVTDKLEKEKDFDPYAGRKLYSYLYDLDFNAIDVSMCPHHLIFGTLSETDSFNWTQKIIIAAKNSGYTFPEFEDGWEGFFREFSLFFQDPRRFTYTPLIICRGTVD